MSDSGPQQGTSAPVIVAGDDVTGCTSVEIKGNLSGQLNIGCETHLHQHVHHVTSTCSGGDPAATKAVEVFTHKGNFLLRIQPKFITEVKPIQTGLVDRLREAGVLDGDGEQQIVSKEKCEDRARTVWIHLNKVPAKLFADRCVPVLASVCPHVLEGATFVYSASQDVRCLRHFIMANMPAVRFADVLVATQACTLEEYRQIVESTDSEEGKWELVFSLCARDDDEYDTEDARKDYQNLVLSVQSSLKNIGMAIPANFDLIMFEGFPCKCLRSCPSMKNRTKKRRCRRAPEVPLLKRASYGEDLLADEGAACCQSASEDAASQSSSSDYPHSTSSEEDRRPNDVQSPGSHTSDEPPETKEDSDQKQARFDTHSDKQKFLKLLEDLSTAIEDALSVKRLFLRLNNVKEIASVLAEKACSETQDMDYDIGKMVSLQGTAQQLHKSLNTCYERAARILERAEISMRAPSWIPLHRKKMLQDKHFVLVNELNEASTFCRKSETTMKQIKKSIPPRFGLTSSYTGVC